MHSIHSHNIPLPALHAEALTSAGFKAVVETNLLGTFLMCREAWSQWMEEHGGSIVSITMITTNGVPRMAHSGAARAGVETLTRSLATEWARSGVRVNCVAPGVVYTSSGMENYGALGDMVIEEVSSSLPYKRLGTPEEVAAATLFLLSGARGSATMGV